MQCFIFDFNGTLFLDSPMHLAAWRIFYKNQGVDFTDDMFYKYMCGPPNSAILRRMIRPDLTDDEVTRLSEEKERIYRQIVLSDERHRALAPGAPEMLDMLKSRGVPFAIATGSFKANCDFYIEALGIDRWFDYSNLFYAEFGMPGKPDPAIYRLAMEKLGFAPEDTVVVEDAMDGVHSAIGAGVQSIIAIDSTLGPEAFREIPQVKAVIHDFKNFERFVR